MRRQMNQWINEWMLAFVIWSPMSWHNISLPDNHSSRSYEAITRNKSKAIGDIIDTKYPYCTQCADWRDIEGTQVNRVIITMNFYNILCKHRLYILLLHHLVMGCLLWFGKWVREIKSGLYSRPLIYCGFNTTRYCNTDPSHKSRNSTVGHGIGALWDLCNKSIPCSKKASEEDLLIFLLAKDISYFALCVFWKLSSMQQMTTAYRVYNV